MGIKEDDDVMLPKHSIFVAKYKASAAEANTKSDKRKSSLSSISPFTNMPQWQSKATAAE